MIDGPLAGIRILDLTHVWAGPLAVRFLADLGADVVKVEAATSRGPLQFPAAPLGGWLGGEAGVEPWNANAIFAKLARNRRSLCIDLKDPSGRETFLELVGQADLVMENFSARAMPALNLDYAALREANERIIYVTMPGFGASGPYRDRVAFGPTVEPMSGITSMFGYDRQNPRNTAMALMDPITATNATAAVMTALRQRERTGVGCRVEMSLHEGGVHYSGPWLVDRQLGAEPHCLGNGHPNMAPHGVYRCSGDDAWLALACADDAQWRGLCGLLSDASLSERWSLAERLQEATQIDAAIGAWTQQVDKQNAAQRLQDAGVSAGPVNTTPDMVDDAQVQARGFFVPYEAHRTPMPGNPIKMGGLDSSQWTPCPRLGNDNAEVLREWLDYDLESINELEDSGVLRDRPPA